MKAMSWTETTPTIALTRHCSCRGGGGACNPMRQTSVSRHLQDNQPATPVSASQGNGPFVFLGKFVRYFHQKRQKIVFFKKTQRAHTRREPRDREAFGLVKKRMMEACSLLLRSQETYTHTYTNCKQTDEQHNARSGCQFLVSWSSNKTDKACSTPVGAFLRGQVRSSDLDLRGKKDGAALWQYRPDITTPSPEYHPTFQFLTEQVPHAPCDVYSLYFYSPRGQISETHTHTHIIAKHSTTMVAECESSSVGVKQKACSTPIGAFLEENSASRCP